jgi:phospholipase B1
MALLAFAALIVASSLVCALPTADMDRIVAAIRSDWPNASNETLYKVAALVIQRSDLVNETELAAPVGAINCPTFAPRAAPTSIRDLRPQDVSVIGAVGDSVTTASNALSTTWLNLKIYPGLSWSMGGDTNVITMANLLKHFNPSLHGLSFGTGSDNMNLNKAVGGSTIQDLDPQVDRLIAAFRARPNFATEWKVATLFVGGNNLCDICTQGGMDRHGPQVFENYLRIALRALSTVPRLFVNLVHGFQYSQLHQYVGPFCSAAMPFLCTCITSNNVSDRQLVDRISAEYNAVMNRVSAEFRGFSDTFAVVIQPFLSNTAIPDRSYISQADCFHPSGKGQILFGTGLWNNMIEPINSKTTRVDAQSVYRCPAASTLLYTP